MKARLSRQRIAHAIKQLERSMDFVARHPALMSSRGKEAQHLARIYQQLGQACEFLALQCRHEGGFTKIRGGNRTCAACGTLEGVTEHWLLLPRVGRVKIGRHRVPTGAVTFPNRKAAMRVDDTLSFYGAVVRVQVHEEFRSRLFKRRPITIAADRSVQLREGETECSVDSHMVRVRLIPRGNRSQPPFGAFVSELSRKELGRFPLLVEYDARGDLVGVCVFRKQHSAKGEAKATRRTRRDR